MVESTSQSMVSSSQGDKQKALPSIAAGREGHPLQESPTVPPDVEASFGKNRTALPCLLAPLKKGSLSFGRLHVSGLRFRVRNRVSSIVNDSHGPSRTLTQVGISSMDGVAVVS
jgi:hypothetical protein